MDGRNRNRSLGSPGTASPVRIDQAASIISGQWDGRPETYYNVPLITKAQWEWPIVLYFFLGGLAGNAFLIATLADLFGAKHDKNLVRWGYYLSFLGLLPSPVLLIIDLGRPERFHHMLRIFKLRSPMSLGTWGLTSFGLCCGLRTAIQAANDGLLNWFPLIPRTLKWLPTKLIGVMGSFFGLFVASYTGVLLAATAVPVWGRARHILGPLFLTSGLSTALASLSVLLSLSGRDNQSSLERMENAEIVTMGTELGLLTSLLPILGPLGKPLLSGKHGTAFKVGTLGGGVILPLLVRLSWKLAGKHLPRPVNIAASILVLIGGYILRNTWIEAGRESADDPSATHYYNAIEWEEQTRRKRS